MLSVFFKNKPHYNRRRSFYNQDTEMRLEWKGLQQWSWTVDHHYLMNNFFIFSLSALSSCNVDLRIPFL